jgi:hypothetical protein
MDLNDLKSAWETYSSQEMNKHRLDKDTIRELLKTRTKSLVERIDRNIQIGLGILLIFIGYVIADSMFLSAYFSKVIINNIVEYPQWLVPVDFFSITLIVATYLFFVIKYIRIKKNFSIDRQLKDLLQGILETVITYRRLFYLAVAMFLLNLVVVFSAGLYDGLKIQADSGNISVWQLVSFQIWKLIGIGLLILVPLITFLFFFLRWGFNKLYGNYLQSIRETIKELDESETTEEN